MGTKEHYYTSKQYSNIGLDPFLEHASQYLRSERTVPVSKTGARHHSGDIYFTFSNTLLTKFIEETDSMREPYKAAIKHGFGGHSKGGLPGIFYLRDEDKGLIRAMNHLVIANKEAIINDLGINEEGLDALKNVKIAWHNPNNGKRIVGSYYTKNGRIIFLDFASY